MTLKEEINRLHDQLSNNGWQINGKALGRLLDILESIDARFDNVERVQSLLAAEIKGKRS